ncbi:MLO-like protein 12 [Solanum tuberosum]|uniref:MLO-like protein n=1 Tax=Solanum tuberosum TaxID=4113 RepID=A0A097KYB9_SOLTU|nr:MLO-like protein 12 [Solanum tuberosum]AIT98395.1 MLO1 [Solanum tuberosum]
MAKERSMEATPTWAIAVVCFILLAISIFIEQIIHHIGEWLLEKRKKPLYEALEKIKAELMLLGFLSLLLTVLQEPVSNLCVPKSIGYSWHPCKPKADAQSEYEVTSCDKKGKVQFASSYAIHQLHIFIFVLAVAHVLYCIATFALGRLKMRKWRAWEDETKTIEYQFYNDPERFRFARETSFGRRHMHFWSKSPVLLWIVCFFRQFFSSVAKVDYLTLRHGFMMAHLTPQNQNNFDFQIYINRAVDKDFKVVVGISPALWLFTVLYFLTTTDGLYSYLWVPFVPLVIILLVGTKLQMIITEMGVRISERGDIVKGVPVVETGDHLFWFNRPGLVLFLINFVLFQNAFQVAFFVWSWWKFGFPSCFHQNAADLAIRLTMGVIIQVHCSYVTLPLYALVTQMGSSMKPIIFGDNVATALRSWHHTAKKRVKHGLSGHTTPANSRPTTPLHGTSPVHLLRGYPQYNEDSVQASPRTSNVENEGWANEISNDNQEGEILQHASTDHNKQIEITMSDFTFGNK